MVEQIHSSPMWNTWSAELKARSKDRCRALSDLRTRQREELAALRERHASEWVAVNAEYKGPPPATAARFTRVLSMLKDGKRLDQIAQELQVSYGRAQQIACQARKWGGLP